MKMGCAFISHQYPLLAINIYIYIFYRNKMLIVYIWKKSLWGKNDYSSFLFKSKSFSLYFVSSSFFSRLSCNKIVLFFVHSFQTKCHGLKSIWLHKMSVEKWFRFNSYAIRSHTGFAATLFVVAIEIPVYTALKINMIATKQNKSSSCFNPCGLAN